MDSSLLRFGHPLPHGSLDTEQFTPCFLYFPFGCSEITGRLGLFSSYREEELSLAAMCASVDFMRACDGPFSLIDQQKTSACNFLKTTHWNEINRPSGDLPRFAPPMENIEIYHYQQNAAWGLFYCEFYRFTNELLASAPELLRPSLGYHWGTSLSGFGKLAPGSAGGVDTGFDFMLQAFMDFVNVVVDNTPCLLHPVGANHMLPGNNEAMETQLEELLDILRSRKGWLHKNRSKKVGLRWKKFMLYALNLQGLFQNAAVLTACRDSMVHEKYDAHAYYSDKHLHELIAEDPLMYGYTMRTELVKHFILDLKVPATAAYIPFDFAKFASNLACRTGVNVIHYMPPFLRVRMALKVLVQGHTQCTEYMGSYKTCFGDQYSNVWENMFARMRHEYSLRPIEIDEEPMEKMIHKYPELLLIALRCKEKTPEAKNFVCDMSVEGDIVEWRNNFFTLLCTSLAALHCKSSNFNKVPCTDGVLPSEWKPYGTYEEKGEPGAAICPLFAKHKYTPVWRRLVKYSLSLAKFRSLVLRRRAIEVLRTLIRQKLRAREMKYVSSKHAADVARAKQRNKEEAAQCAMQRMQRMNATSHILFLDLRTRLEYFCFWNLRKDHFLQSFMNPYLGTIPYEVFCNREYFPSLHGLLCCIGGNPVDAIFKSIMGSALIQPTLNGVQLTAHGFALWNLHS